MEKQNNKKEIKVKKILKIVGDVLFGLFLVFILFISVTNIRAKQTNGIPNVFGKGYLTVLSDSMDGDKEDSFKIGDLIFVKIPSTEEQNNIKVGDIITYRSYTNKDANGDFMIISHRVIEVSTNNNLTVYITQGDNPKTLNATNQGKEGVRPELVLGVYEGKWEGAGYAFSWFGSSAGFFVIVVVPCILFLIFTIINFVRTYMEYKNDKNKVALAGGPDSIENKIRLRKEAFDDLVKEGTLTREVADQAFAEFVKNLTSETASSDAPIDVTPTEEAPVVEEKVEPTVVEETPSSEEVPTTNEEVPQEVVEEKVNEVPSEETKVEEVKTEPKKKATTTKKATAKKPSEKTAASRKAKTEEHIKASVGVSKTKKSTTKKVEK